MQANARATLLFFYQATQPFVWINKGTNTWRMQWLIENGYLEEVATRWGKARVKVSEKGKAYAYRELGR